LDETRAGRIEFEIVEKSADRRQVFGWASVSADKDGHPVVDLGGDLIPVAELEKAAYAFAKDARVGGEMHQGEPNHQLIASVVFTEDIQKALGIPPGTVPVGWFVGFEVSPDAFERVKSGARLQLSIEGRARRQEIA
jgi:hypothetical protein